MTERHRAASTESLEALAHPDRLGIVRIVVAGGPDGLASGEVARRAGLSPAATSYHLAWLGRAGILTARRAGRSIVYRADRSVMADLVEELVRTAEGDGWPPFALNAVWSIPAGHGPAVEPRETYGLVFGTASSPPLCRHPD